VIDLSDSTGSRRDFWQRTINEMPGQFQLPGIFRWTPIADQLWVPTADGDTRVTSDTPPTHSMHYLLDVP
jgi:hypothetical protein